MADILKVFKNINEVGKTDGDVSAVYTVPAAKRINMKNLTFHVKNKKKKSGILSVELDGITIDSAQLDGETTYNISTSTDIIAEAGSSIAVSYTKSDAVAIANVTPIVNLTDTDYYVGKLTGWNSDDTAVDSFNHATYEAHRENLWSTSYAPIDGCMFFYNNIFYSAHNNDGTVVVVSVDYAPTTDDVTVYTNLFPSGHQGITTDGVYLYSLSSTASSSLKRVKIADLFSGTYTVEELTLATDASGPEGSGSGILFHYYNGCIYTCSDYNGTTNHYGDINRINLSTLKVTNLNNIFSTDAYQTYQSGSVITEDKNGVGHLCTVTSDGTNVRIVLLNLSTEVYSSVDITTLITTKNFSSNSRIIEIGKGHIYIVNMTSSTDTKGAIYDINTGTATQDTTYLGNYYQLTDGQGEVNTVLLSYPTFLDSGSLDIDLSIYATGVESDV